MQLTLTTLWELESTGLVTDEIREYFSVDMVYSDIRHGAFYDAQLDTIQLRPLGNMQMEKKVIDTDLVSTKTPGSTGKMISEAIDLIVANLRAAKQWIKFMAKRGK